APGPWCEIGNTPVKTSFKFVYSFDESLCNLTIDEAILQLPEEKPISALLFAANLHHEIVMNGKEERLNDLYQIIGNWQNDLDIFKDIASKILALKEVA
ncbi:MAG: hypothetical protein QQN41_09235, partial [Nitrosopumilus sp.]